MLDRVLQQAQRMEDMMRRLGVDPAVAARKEQGTAFARARGVCMRCPSAPQCARWLAQSAGTGLAEPPRFCPLAAFFASLPPAA
jgi:hypothetical protein